MAKEDKVKTPKSKKTKQAKVKGAEADGGKTRDAEGEAVPYDVRMAAVTVISKPMADEKKVRAASCVCTSSLCRRLVIHEEDEDHGMYR